MNGTIKRIQREKGFGFIRAGAQEFFFHRSVVQEASFEDLHEGQDVTFESEPSPKGPRASAVRPAR